MLMKNCIYGLSKFILLLSIILFIYSIINKNKKVCKKIILVNSIYFLYVVAIVFITFYYELPFGLEVLFFYLIWIISIILCIISTIINIVKAKKTNSDEFNKKLSILFNTLILIPLVIITTSIIYNKHLINNSDLLLVYYSAGNGGFDGSTFAYAVNNNSCKEFDMGIDLEGYYLNKYIPFYFAEVEKNNNLNGYKVKEKDDIIHIYKNNKLICKVNNNREYFNIDLRKAYLKI